MIGGEFSLPCCGETLRVVIQRSPIPPDDVNERVLGACPACQSPLTVVVRGSVIEIAAGHAQAPTDV